jgi:outer membrane protein assembly factor BamB
LRAGRYAYSAQIVKTLWHQTTAPSYRLSVANGIVYTDTDGGNNGDYAIIALNGKNGSIIWESSQAGNAAPPATPVMNGVVYAGCSPCVPYVALR